MFARRNSRALTCPLNWLTFTHHSVKLDIGTCSAKPVLASWSKSADVCARLRCRCLGQLEDSMFYDLFATIAGRWISQVLSVPIDTELPDTSKPTNADVPAWLVLLGSRVGFTNRLCRLKPRASRSKGASSKVWYA